jgi:hypothetical protein
MALKPRSTFPLPTIFATSYSKHQATSYSKHQATSYSKHQATKKLKVTKEGGAYARIVGLKEGYLDALFFKKNPLAWAR